MIEDKFPQAVNAAVSTIENDSGFGYWYGFLLIALIAFIYFLSYFFKKEIKQYLGKET